MKDLHGQSTAAVAASPRDCLALLEAVDRYPEWHPEVVREVEVLERDEDGRPLRARATLRVARGPLVKDVEAVLAIEVDPDGVVKLTRVPDEPGDEETFEVTWRLQSGRRTRIRLELEATLDVPRLLPLGGIGDAMAHGFVSAALAELRSKRPVGRR
jgi:ribosome-associated toxin RatA of RatAB toxin-antitoxin module